MRVLCWCTGLLLAFVLPAIASAQGDIPLGLPTLGGSTTQSASTTGSLSTKASSSAATTAAKSTDSSAKSTISSRSVASKTTATSSDAQNTGLPGLSSATISKTAYDGIQNAPTLTGGPTTYPHAAPSVPPTADAPFMQRSSLPDGTVFIAVGAALGFFFMIFLAWRGLVAWSLRRSIKRANSPFPLGGKKGLFTSSKIAHGPEGVSMLRSSVNPFYKGAGAANGAGLGSTMSLDPLNPLGGRAGSHNSAQPAPSSLFFSPTAGAGLHTTVNRHSSYLPAGYYNAGGGIPGATSSTSQLASQRPVSMADFTSTTTPGRADYGYQRSRSTGPSPPSTPGLGGGPDLPYGRNQAGGLSTGSLGQKSEGRAPSAYLEDLFDAPPVPQPGTMDRDRNRRRSGF